MLSLAMISIHRLTSASLSFCLDSDSRFRRDLLLFQVEYLCQLFPIPNQFSKKPSKEKLHHNGSVTEKDEDSKTMDSPMDIPSDEHHRINDETEWSSIERSTLHRHRF